MKRNLSKNWFGIGFILVAIHIISMASVNSQLDFGGTKALGLGSLKELLEKAKAKMPLLPSKDKDKDPLGGKRFGDEDNYGQGHHGHVQLVPQSICLLKSDPGFCNLIVGRWYYDHRYHRCLPFLFTGCGGNPNNFTTMKKCEISTRHCHFLGAPVQDPITRYALQNPMNPLGNLANGYVLAG